MKTTKIQKGLVLLALASGMLAIGCELIVDFDRTRIPVDTTEASTDSGTTVDASTADASDDAADATTDADAGDLDASNDADADN